MISNKRTQSILLIIWFLLGSSTCMTYGQEERLNRRIAKLETEVSQKWSDFDLESAKSALERLIKIKPSRTESWLLLARLADQSEEIVLRDSAYRQIISLSSEGYPQINILYSESLWNQGLYFEASEILREFTRWDSVPKEIFKRYDHLNQCIIFSLDQLADGDGVPIRRLPEPVNSDDDEYFPALTVDGNLLVFTRQGRNHGASGKSVADEQLFSAHWSVTSFSGVAELGPTVNTSGNEGTQTIRQDGRWMIYTACNRPDTKGGCDLYLSVRIGNEWSPGVNLGYPVNTRYWESTPALAPDGRGMIFASNRPGGQGGMDLWYTRLLEEGGWMTPVNLGRTINSENDEIAPFLHSDGRSLFFSSNGHIGMGGFDLYRSLFISYDSVNEPNNLGYPINTFHNEDGITMNGISDRVIIASNRDSSKGRDLFFVEISMDAIPDRVVPLSGIVKDGISGAPLEANIKISTPHSSYSSMVDTDPVNGQFLVGLPSVDSLRLTVQKEGYLFYSAIYNIGEEMIKVNPFITIDLMPIQKGSSTVLRNVFFEFDSAEILPQSFPELSDLCQLLLSNPRLRLEVSGHTDSIGSESYNLLLSQMRADSICQYLNGLGINLERLIAKGYGETRPISSNDTEEGQGLNRRTEISVISGR